MNQFESYLYSFKKSVMTSNHDKPQNFSDHNIEKRAGTDKDRMETSSIKTASKPKNEQNMKQSLLAS